MSLHDHTEGRKHVRERACACVSVHELDKETEGERDSMKVLKCPSAVRRFVATISGTYSDSFEIIIPNLTNTF